MVMVMMIVIGRVGFRMQPSLDIGRFCLGDYSTPD